MGAFFTNCHVRTKDKNACVKTLKAAIKARALVTDPKNDWITVYDETTEAQNAEDLRNMGKTLSSKLNTSVFCFMVHDSDIFMYLLFDKGKLVDQFDSKPDYFGPVSKEQQAEWAGHVKRIVKYAAPGATTEAIQKCLKRRQIVEDDRQNS